MSNFLRSDDSTSPRQIDVLVESNPAPRPVKYRVREPLLAIHNDPKTPTKFLTIERGFVITLTSQVQQCDFVDVCYEDLIVKVFMLDIERNADQVEAPAAEPA